MGLGARPGGLRGRWEPVFAGHSLWFLLLALDSSLSAAVARLAGALVREEVRTSDMSEVPESVFHLIHVEMCNLDISRKSMFFVYPSSRPWLTPWGVWQLFLPYHSLSLTKLSQFTLDPNLSPFQESSSCFAKHRTAKFRTDYFARQLDFSIDKWISSIKDSLKGIPIEPHQSNVKIMNIEGRLGSSIG